MNFLEYSNQTQSNIIPEKEFKELTQEVFNVIATNLSRSLGPLGSSATILDGLYTEATKDGFSILNKYCFHNRYKKMIYNLIKAPCSKMNNTVGDGTTTAIALTNAMFNRYQSRRGNIETLYRLPRQFANAWDEVIEDVIKRVKEKAKTISSDNYDEIYNIAYVTSNGNAEISKNIADTYKIAKSPAIKEKDSPTNKSYISAINGFDFPANLISDAFVRNEDLSVTESNVVVMIFDYKIETDLFKNLIAPIDAVIRAQGKKLLVLAPYYDVYMCDTIVNQYISHQFRSGGISLILAQYAIGKLNKHQLADLAVILRTKVLNQEMVKGILEEMPHIDPDTMMEKIFNDPEYQFYRIIGQASSAMMTCNAGSIFQVTDIESDEKYQEVLNRAKHDLEEIKSTVDYEKQSYADKIYEANTRVLQLQMQNFIYYIGADSDLQKQILWDAVDDVIKCVRSAIRSGIVPGCQLTIVKACDEAINEILGTEPKEEYSKEDLLKIEIYGLIENAIIDVYSLILNGPRGDGILKLIDGWDSIDKEYIQEFKDKTIAYSGKLIKESIEVGKVFDLESLEFNDRIITSAETDTMVLTAASELIKILINGNQCIVSDAAINETETHEITM